MERIDLNKEYSFAELSRIERINRRFLGNLPIHGLLIDNYVKVISFFPLSKTKQKIFSSLDRRARMGMLNRHILSVARNMEISQVILKKAKEETIEFKRCKSQLKYDKDFWEVYVEKHSAKIEDYYGIIIKMIIEEIDKRKNVKYLRMKKLKEIYDKNDNNY